MNEEQETVLKQMSEVLAKHNAEAELAEASEQLQRLAKENAQLREALSGTAEYLDVCGARDRADQIKQLLTKTRLEKPR